MYVCMYMYIDLQNNPKAASCAPLGDVDGRSYSFAPPEGNCFAHLCNWVQANNYQWSAIDCFMCRRS